MTEPLLANRYRIIDKIGEGGMGKVWRVYDTVDQREVALKQFYRKESLDEAKRQKGKGISLSTISTKSTEAGLRFKQEFRTMVKLKHPNTVNVFDYGVLENGDDYITMEIVPGKELRDILKERQLDFEEIYRILIQTCQVLNFIHSRIMVHRDIKPSNIRITPEGNVKLMDFGLMDQIGLPSSGKIIGTVIYLPPEVAKGGIIDARSDLYSLGVMAYELVTGQPPFVGRKTLDIMRQHIETPPIPPRQIREDTPEKLERIILKLLAKDQNERYQTTAELINDLVQLTGEKISIETLEQRKSYLNCSELIGREREMQELKDAFTLTTQGKGQGIFIAAPAGVGKTRLIQEFKLKVQLAEIPFMQGECFEQGMATYQPLADAFKPLLPLTKKEVLDKYGPVLVKVIPELKSKGYEPAPELEELGEKARLFEQITGWLREVSEITPIVICIEDLHWSDFATLELLNSCIRETRFNPVMILGAFRDDEVEPTSILFQTVEEEITQLMKLSTLNKGDVQALIKGMLGRIELTEEFTDHLYTATAGNAFFVSETMRALIEEEQLKLERGRWLLPADISRLKLPTSIGATVIRRLNLLGSEAIKLARIAAVVGRGLDLSFLKELTGLEDEKLFDILDELIERQFMKSEEKHYAFTHDRVRETLYGQLDEEEKWKLHEQSATIIELRHIDNIEPVVDELAFHFSRSKNSDKAIKYLLIAGEGAYKKTILRRACSLLSQAVDLLETHHYPNKEAVLVQTRDKLIESSVWIDSKLCAKQAMEQYKQVLELGNVLRFIKTLKAIFKIIGLLPELIADKIRLIAFKPPVPKEKIRGDYPSLFNYIIRALGYGTYSFFASGDMEKAIELSELGFSYLPDNNSIPFGEVVGAGVGVYLPAGKHVTVHKRLLKSIEIFDRFRKHLGHLETWVFALLLYQTEYVQTYLAKNHDQPILDRCLKMAKEHKLVDIELWTRVCELEWSSFRGAIREFNKAFQEVQQISKRVGRPIIQGVFAYNQVARFYCLRHEFDLAEPHIQKFESLAEQANFTHLKYYAKCYRALLLSYQKRYDEAINLLNSAIDFCREQGFDFLPEALFYLGEINLKKGEIEEAKFLINEAQNIAENHYEDVNVWFKARTNLLLGEISLLEKKFVAADNYLKQCQSVSDENDLYLDKGLAFLGLARLYFKLTQYSKAREILASTVRILSELDCKYYLKKAKDLAAKLGGE